MAAPKYYGCVVLSRALQKVLLVKPQGCQSWCFPIGDVDSLQGHQAATSVVSGQTGISLVEYINEEDFIEEPFPPGASTLARLYIVHSVPRKRLTPVNDCSIQEVEWHDFRSILELPDATTFQEAAVKPFVKKLREWTSSRHHLRAEFYPEVGNMILFNKGRHTYHSSAATILRNTVLENGLMDERYEVFVASEVMFAKESVPYFEYRLYGCTCVLPHLQLNITPEVCYADMEDAKHMAAMVAVLYLAGGIDHQTKSVHFSPMGSPPPQEPLWNEEVAIYARRNREGLLLNGGLTTWHCSGHNMIGRSAAVQYKHTLRTPAVILKEFCEKKDYTLQYQFECKDDGFIGLITIVQLGLIQFDGDWRRHKREAKENVSSLMLGLLKERGLYV